MEEIILRDPYQPKHYPLLVVISGPSGVGKDSVVQALAMREDYAFHFVVTATSRAPRPNEVDGVDYFFVSEAEFESLIHQGELLEYALVYGQYKGIPKQQVREALASGKDVIMRLDVQGAATIRQLIPQAVLIFLSAASEEELVVRLCRRQSESETQLVRRIEMVREEMLHLDEFDYVVVNRECHLQAAVEDVLSIITAEHARVHPRQVIL
ncbi:MAG: guanylate kinase [Anaerolineae bacterium]|nr:guanylate kinase [Anaerolineae bacterium]